MCPHNCLETVAGTSSLCLSEVKGAARRNKTSLRFKLILNVGARAACGLQDETIDWKDVAIYASYGPLLSNLGHTWYRHLHVFTNRTLRMTTWQMVSTKLAADAFVFGPLHVTALLTWTHFWQNKPLNVRFTFVRRRPHLSVRYV